MCACMTASVLNAVVFELFALFLACSEAGGDRGMASFLEQLFLTRISGQIKIPIKLCTSVFVGVRLYMRW